MTEQALLQLIAVIVGGLLTITGGFVSTLLLEQQKQRAQSRNLALAFKGEIGALVMHMKIRRYRERIREVIAQIETTQEPFYMPIHIRFKYDRVYENNVDKIGLLKGSLPEQIPSFYTQLLSLMEDMVNLGQRVYAPLDLETLLRVYQDMVYLIDTVTVLGEEILLEVDRRY